MTIYLVRHGETIFNARRILQFPDTPLSERGVEQAERVARRLADAGIVHILSSDHLRALTTAQAIRKAIIDSLDERISSSAARGSQADASVRLRRVPLEVDRILRERDFGAYRGVAYDDLEEDVFAPDHLPPDGESAAAFEARIAVAWERVLAEARSVEADGNDEGDESAPALAVVSHGLVCDVLLRNHLHLPPEIDPAEVKWLNTCVTEIERDIEGRWQVTRLACTAHLEGMDSLPPSSLGHV
ncbi:histidine phosphatase family protein [Thioalkalivibrio sp. HK1]|uniref:histidine phosphatase family protein n=1 Tax=Thioalkalivibrio sp. HK1 TaxID=1469245 RepID=UPI00046ECEE3|nr:histidine phosphatase family protein [Thioalkalivibrio sp. HK1]